VLFYSGYFIVLFCWKLNVYVVMFARNCVKLVSFGGNSGYFTIVSFGGNSGYFTIVSFGGNSGYFIVSFEEEKEEL